MVASMSPPETFAEMWERLGNVPLNRIHMFPPPGTATVEDVERLCNREPKSLCELIDGVLVEKATGHFKSRLEMRLAHLFGAFLDEHDLGIVTAANGPHRIHPDQIRLPDVAFIAYENIPADADQNTAVPEWIPSLALEILSESNTKAEMTRKLRDDFDAGVKLVRYVDPPTRSVRVYRSPETFVTKSEHDELAGEDVLPGFRVSIRDWFDRALRVRPN